MNAPPASTIRLPLAPPPADVSAAWPSIGRLRADAFDRLAETFRPERERFVFRTKRTAGERHAEGLSRRYTAIVLIGLAGEDRDRSRRVLGGRTPADVCTALVNSAPADEGIGDRALVAWAAHATACADAAKATTWMLASGPDITPCPVVELAWALSALCQTDRPGDREAADRVAARLMASFGADARVFPHQIGAGRLRTHVACFADQVYPILALSQYFAISGRDRALGMAIESARHISALQGSAGQWWWHYDVRTGAVVEGYPVYSVHQHAMAPMALRALEVVSGLDFCAPITRGLEWLEAAPELGGGSLIDSPAGIIWRKVARREPSKASRYLQALASRVHRHARWPGLDTLFPPVAIDFEYRPYELGWLLYAWPQAGRGASPAALDRH